MIPHLRHSRVVEIDVFETVGEVAEGRVAHGGDEAVLGYELGVPLFFKSTEY